MSHLQHRFYILLAVFFLLLPTFAFSQKPTGQPAQVNAAIDVTFTSIQPTKDGLMVSVSYVNHFPEPIQFTLTYPQERAGFASDNLGNAYTLVNATGMVRKIEAANFDLTHPDRYGEHSTFLLAPSNQTVSASFYFKRTTQQDPEAKEKPTTFNVSVSHYARPAEKFDPKHPGRAFGFTATITNAKSN